LGLGLFGLKEFTIKSGLSRAQNHQNQAFSTETKKPGLSPIPTHLYMYIITPKMTVLCVIERKGQRFFLLEGLALAFVFLSLIV
jgi:hypothetical protein